MTEHINSHPLLTISGFLASIMVAILPSMDSLQEDIKFAGVCLGIIVALVTIYAKIVEIKYRRLKIRDAEQK
jgi:hypothetical protein